MCLSSPVFDLSGARPVDFLPHACYPSRPAVSGVTGAYSSTTFAHLRFSLVHGLNAVGTRQRRVS